MAETAGTNPLVEKECTLPDMSAVLYVDVSYWVSVAIMSAVLLWGLRLVHASLTKPVKIGAADDKETVLTNALREKRNLTDSEESEESTPPPSSSSRIAVAIGAVGLAAFFIGLAYFSLHSLFFNPCNLAGLDDLKVVIAGGAALFLPYAFNSIASIFDTPAKA